MVDALQTQRGERGKKTSLLPRLSIIHSMVKGKPQQYGAYPTAPVTLTDSRVIGHADTSMIKAKKMNSITRMVMKTYRRTKKVNDSTAF
jgi:hypothetical protein